MTERDKISKLADDFIMHFSPYFTENQIIRNKFIIDNATKQFGDFKYPGISSQICLYSANPDDKAKLTSYCLEFNWDEKLNAIRIAFGVRRREFSLDTDGFNAKVFHSRFETYFPYSHFNGKHNLADDEKMNPYHWGSWIFLYQTTPEEISNMLPCEFMKNIEDTGLIDDIINFLENASLVIFKRFLN